MTDPYALFRQKAPWLMGKLIEDFGFAPFQAAGDAGSAGYESNGFRTLQEVHPWAGRGGYGWYMWTGARRLEYEDYCRRNHLDPAADATNYAFHFLELTSDEAATVVALKKTTTLQQAVDVFEVKYEGAGVPALKGRIEYAQMALDAFNALQKAAA